MPPKNTAGKGTSSSDSTPSSVTPLTAKVKKAIAARNAALKKAEKAKQDAIVRARAASMKAKQSAGDGSDHGSDSELVRKSPGPVPRTSAAPEEEDEDDDLGIEAPVVIPDGHFLEDLDDDDDDVLPPSSDPFGEIPSEDEDLDVATVYTATGARKRAGVPLMRTPTKKSKIPPGLTAHPDNIKGKKKMSHFTPRTARIMAKAKQVARGESITQNPFIPPDVRQKHYQDLMLSVANDPKFGSEALLITVRRILDNSNESGSMPIFADFIHYGDGDIKYRLMLHVRGVIHGIVTACGTDKSTIKATVAWLKSTNAFIFGGLNMKEKTFDANAQFNCEWFTLMMRWYLFEQTGKSDLVGYHCIVGIQQIPGPTVALLCTMAYHVLTEWEDGTHSRSDFNQRMSSKYLEYLARIDKLKTLAPAYWEEVSSAIFQDVVRQSNKEWLLQKASDEVDDANIDYAAMQAGAKGRKAAASSV